MQTEKKAAAPAHQRFAPVKAEVKKSKTAYDLALEEAEKAKPSADPQYWAKPSCNKCYGRGLIGKVTIKVDTNTIVQHALCICARKRFVKWRDPWVAEYLKKNAAK